MPRTDRLQVIALVLAGCLAAAIAVLVPFQTPMYGYFLDAQEWARTGRIVDTFTPLAYPLLIGPAYRLGGVWGIVALQALLYVGIVWIAMRVLVRMGVGRRWAVVGAGVIAVYPEYLLSIPKVWDVDLSVFLLLLFVDMCLRLYAAGARLGRAAGLGAVAGAGMFCRPNYVLMAPVVVYALWASPRRTAAGAVRPLVVIAAMAAGVFALLGVASHGAVFLPRNGPYNLFAGHNELSAQTLLEKLNAEPSIPLALAELYPGKLGDMTAPGFYYSPRLEPVYDEASLKFAEGHPVAEAKLAGIKLLTLFRPDTKVHGLASADGAVKLLLALPAPLLICVLLWSRRAGLDWVDRMLLLTYAAYIAPFVVTNSDPRFRLPLDGLLVLHTVRRVYLMRNGEVTRAAADMGFSTTKA